MVEKLAVQLMLRKKRGVEGERSVRKGFGERKLEWEGSDWQGGLHLTLMALLRDMAGSGMV